MKNWGSKTWMGVAVLLFVLVLCVAQLAGYVVGRIERKGVQREINRQKHLDLYGY